MSAPHDTAANTATNTAASTLAITLDPSGPTPPYEQVRDGIAALVTAGRLLPGDKLPTVRALAADLGLAAGTVARAYKDLEVAGLVTTARRAGTVVAATEQAARVALSHLARQYAAAARSAGLADDAALDLVRAELAARPA